MHDHLALTSPADRPPLAAGVESGFGQLPAQARRVAIVANPFSGARRNGVLVEQLAVALKSCELEPQPFVKLDELAAICRSGAAEDYRCIVVAGGDGTLHRVLNERLPLPIAMLPLGNENLFARCFGYRCDPAGIARAIAAGRVRPTDLGSVNGQLFSVVASAGFDGDVVERLARWRNHGHQLRRVTSLKYVVPLAKAAWLYSYPTLEINADGQIAHGALAMVFNLPEYCLRLGLTPDAQCDDGLLDFVVFTRGGRLALASYALSVLLGRHQARSDVIHGRCRRLVITSESVVPVQVDGEAAGGTPLTIEVVPQAARVIVAAGL